MPPDVATYLHARATKGPSLAPDGRLAFRSDTTGTMQCWSLEEPGAWPTQQTFGDERVSFVEWSPAGDRLAFGMDAGANERDQLFTIDPATREVDQLTDRPDAIHAWGGFSPDGTQVAFAANRRDTAVFDLYVQDLEGGADAEPTLVAAGQDVSRREDGGRLFVAGWSPDGATLLAGESHASSDEDLFAVDVATGDATHLTPHDGHVRYRHPTIGPDGDGVYCCSDARSDTLELVRIEVASGALEPVEIERRGDNPDPGSRASLADWSVDGLALDAETGRLCLTRNVDGYSVLLAGSLVDPETATIWPVETPSGVVQDLTIGADGRRAVMTVSATNLNYSIYTLELGPFDPSSREGGAHGSNTETPSSEDTQSSDGQLGVEALERWTVPSPGGVPLERYHVPDLIRYETFDGREIPAYVTLPPSDAENEEPVPVIVDIHGGPHSQRRPSWRNRPIRQYLLEQGYAIFEPNVRGSAGYGAEYAALDDVEKRMDSVRDVAAGVDWLEAHPAIDSEKIVCYGRSYGGFMVLACITEYPDLWAAAVDFVGIANWVTFLENTGEYRRSHREAEYGSLEDDRAFLESISPIHDVERIECPLFVQHGANDPRVPVAEARQIADAVAEQGVPVETCIFEDEGHHTTKRENRIEQFERIVAFLEEHVPPAGGE